MLDTNRLILLGLYIIIRRLTDHGVGGQKNNGSSLERQFLGEAHGVVFPSASTLMGRGPAELRPDPKGNF